MASLNIYPRHVTALDLQFHFEDRESSSVKSIEQDFDYETSEYVITIEYRVKRPEWADPQIERQISEKTQRKVQAIWDAVDVPLRATLLWHPEEVPTMCDQHML